MFTSLLCVCIHMCPIHTDANEFHYDAVLQRGLLMTFKIVTFSAGECLHITGSYPIASAGSERTGNAFFTAVHAVTCY